MKYRRRLLDRLPPALALTLTEVSDSRRQKRAFDDGFLRDLWQQATASAVDWQWADRAEQKPASDYLVVASQALSPLSSILKCGNPYCRQAAGRDFGRFVALYTDGAIVADPLTDVVLQAEDARPISQAILTDFLFLMDLLPLVEEGLLRFSAPVRATCGPCRRELETAPRRLAQQVVRAGRDRLRLELHNHDNKPHLSITNPFLLETTADTVELCRRLSPKQARRLRVSDLPKVGGKIPRATLEFAEDTLARAIEPAVYSTLWHSTFASQQGAHVVSNCRAENLALTAHSPEPNARAIVAAESVRKVRLPWIENVSIAQALQVRAEAGPSLANLRRRLASATNIDTSSLVEELRADADEVERSLKPRRSRALQDIALLPAMVGLVFSGVANDAVTAVAAALFAGAVQLRNQANAEHQLNTALKARPGYALLEAKRLLSKRGNSHRHQ